MSEIDILEIKVALTEVTKTLVDQDAIIKVKVQYNYKYWIDLINIVYFK